MGIKSQLQEVPSLALGTSDVSLLEMTAAYSTLASGGLYHEPTAVTRIEDRYGNVLYEATPSPREALSERTAYTMVDMMRGVIDYGTGVRMRTQFQMGQYDLAGKTGTTQQAADTWFMLMHPQLVTGSWVGFNDRRLHFRSTYWGQGSHTALLLVGEYFRRAAQDDKVEISPDAEFPMPAQFVAETTPADSTSNSNEGGRVGW
jgi:penicillin-binding protein 1A